MTATNSCWLPGPAGAAAETLCTLLWCSAGLALATSGLQDPAGARCSALQSAMPFRLLCVASATMSSPQMTHFLSIAG
jgi:hypothetical protein